MGRFRDMQSDDGAEESIDISPLIDVVFILLIFFIVTTVFVEESGVEVDKPQASSNEPSEEDTTIVLIITEKGGVVHDGSDIGVSGIRPLVTERFREEKVPIIIQTEKEALTGMLVRVIDEVKLAGAETVSVMSL